MVAPQTPWKPVDSSPRQPLPHVPRLSIAHLLLLTTLTAVVMSSPIEWEAGMPQPSLGMIGQLIFFRLLIAATLTGFIVLLWHTGQRTIWRLEPGEWLLVALAVGSLFWMWERVQDSPLNFPHILANIPLWQTIFITIRVAFVAWLLVVAIAARHYRWWSALIGIQALWSFVGSSIYLAATLGYDIGSWTLYLPMLWQVIGAIELILLAIAVSRDHRGAPSRHWLHWLGVSLLIATNTSVLAMSFMM